MKRLSLGLAFVLALALPASAQNIAGGTVSGSTITGTTSVQTPAAGGVIFAGAARNLTITASEPAGSSRTVNLPDPGGSDSVVYLALAQTLVAKTFTTPQIGGAGAGTATLQYANSATGRTYTFPDAGAAANVALVDQTPASLQNQSGVARITGSAYTNATNSFTNVTGLSFAVAANKNYSGVCYLTWQNTGATGDVQWKFTGPAAATSWRQAIVHNTSNAATGVFAHANVTTIGTAYDPNATLAAMATDYTDIIAFDLQNGANAGTIQLQAADHTNTQTIQVEVGSFCTYQ